MFYNVCKMQHARTRTHRRTHSEKDGLELYQESAQQIFKNKCEKTHRSIINHVTLDKQINAEQQARLSHSDCVYSLTVYQGH